MQGQKGFVVFIEGVAGFLQKENLKKILRFHNSVAIDIPVLIDQHDVSQYRYCTEALINLSNSHPDEIRNVLGEMGDSLVIAGSDTCVRVHIHTNDPAGIFGYLTKIGRVINQKVDDMVKQNEITTNRKHNIALLVDTTCDLSAELIAKHQIHMVPVNIFFGEHRFLDRVTISQDTFFELLDTSDNYPTSSQPAIKDLTNTFNYLSSHYDSIIALDLSQKLSGTNANSCQAVCGWASEAKVLVGAKSIDSFIKGGRVSASRGFIAKLLGITPILSIDHE